MAKNKLDLVYRERVKPRGYNTSVPIISLDYSNSGKYIRMRFSNFSKEDHINKAKYFARKSKQVSVLWNRLIDKAAMETWGRKFEITDYKIAAIGSNEFSVKYKNQLREYAQLSSSYLGAAYAHYSAARKRIDSARSDLNKIAGK